MRDLFAIAKFLVTVRHSATFFYNVALPKTYFLTYYNEMSINICAPLTSVLRHSPGVRRSKVRHRDNRPTASPITWTVAAQRDRPLLANKSRVNHRPVLITLQRTCVRPCQRAACRAHSSVQTAESQRIFFWALSSSDSPGVIYIFIRQMAATTNKSKNKTNATNRWIASLTNSQPLDSSYS